MLNHHCQRSFEGWRIVENHGPGASTASLAASFDIMEEETGKSVDMAGKVDDCLVDLINVLAGGGEEITGEAALVTPQKIFSHSVDLHTAKQLKDMWVEERDKTRLNSLGLLRAGDWLNAAPVKALDLHLRQKISLWLPSTSWTCVSTQQLVPALQVGRRVTSLEIMPLCIARRGRGFTMFSGMPFTRQQPSRHILLLPRSSQPTLGSQAKPADVYIPGWANGRDAALDVTMVSSLQQELRRRAAAEVGG
jgi:hypothetical protein